MNDRSRPEAASQVIAATDTSIAPNTDEYPVIGTLVVDFRDHQTSWPETPTIRWALSAIEHLPRGAHVRLFVGRTAFNPYYISDLAIHHVAVTVEGDDVDRIRQWVLGLREARK